MAATADIAEAHPAIKSVNCWRGASRDECGDMWRRRRRGADSCAVSCAGIEKAYRLTYCLLASILMCILLSYSDSDECSGGVWLFSRNPTASYSWWQWRGEAGRCSVPGSVWCSFSLLYNTSCLSSAESLELENCIEENEREL